MKRSVIMMGATLSMMLPLHVQGARVDSKLAGVLQSSDLEQRVPIIVRFTGRPDPHGFIDMEPAQRRERIIRALKQQTAQSQAGLRPFLRRHGALNEKPLWLINGLSLTLPAQAVEKLAQQPAVESISLDATLLAAPTTPGTPAPVRWNLSMMGADLLWQQGYTGQGMVIASMDTGVDAMHPDIASRWRGGSNSWFDPSGEHATPHDIHGHGTQTMGLMIGGDAGGSSIGVAPGAQWIASKIFNDAGVASYSGIHLAYQWMLDPDGDPAVDDAPHVIANAWGLVDAAGSCITEFQVDVDTLHAAGIALAFSAGNAGPAAATSVSPANYAGVLSTGAVDNEQAVASFSSRGPSACDGTHFPTLVAPGVNVHTSDLTFNGLIPDAYIDVSGTSFAVAQVAGAIALLKSAEPHASPLAIETSLRESSRDIGVPGNDNDSGYGLVDLVAAKARLAQLVNPGTVSFTDENYTVNENGGSVQIAVARSGGSSGVISVDYATADGSALAGSDYLTASGVLQFADGETVRTIAVPVVDDLLSESSESFSLTLTNPGGGAVLGWPASATVSITDNDLANSAPVALDDYYETTVDTPLSVPEPGVLANDYDAESTELLVRLNKITPPVNGKLDLHWRGRFVYTPNPGFIGTDSFTYPAKDAQGATSAPATVTITVKAAASNSAPTAINDHAVTTVNTAVSIPVLANDGDVDGTLDRTSVTLVSAPTQGGNRVWVNPTYGGIRFIPGTGFIGTESFSYTVRDNLGAVSNIATVTVDVVN